MFKKFRIDMMFHVKHIKKFFRIVPRETILKICHSNDRRNFRFNSLIFALMSIGNNLILLNKKILRYALNDTRHSLTLNVKTTPCHSDDRRNLFKNFRFINTPFTFHLFPFNLSPFTFHLSTFHLS